MTHTHSEIDRAVKKVQIAIDKMIDLQDMGYGDENVRRILDKLRMLEIAIETKRPPW